MSNRLTPPPSHRGSKGDRICGLRTDGPLSPRQAAIHKLLADGLSNKQVARELGILEGTVKVQNRALFRKLGVKNRTQAAARYVKDDLTKHLQPSAS